MNNLYTAPLQPATCWTDNTGYRPTTFRWPANRLLWCQCCKKRRPAKNCVVQSFYDATDIWCAPNKGCKSKREISAKQNIEFRNRSAGAKAGWLIRKQKALAGKSYPV